MDYEAIPNSLIYTKRDCFARHVSLFHFFNNPFRSWDEVKNFNTLLGFSPQNRERKNSEVRTGEKIRRENACFDKIFF